MVGSEVGRLVGLGLGRDGVVLGVGRADGVGEDVAGGGVGVVVSGASSGNAGSANRYLSGSSFNAAVASAMNCRQIGPGPVEP